MKTLYLCAALAVGEGIAALAPECAPLWPAFAALATLVTLWGYGLGLPGWRYAAMASAGAALFLFASVESENAFRASPWMRKARAREPAAELTPVKRELSRRIGLGLDHERGTADLNRAILLGERWRIPPRMKRVFVDSGTVHVFAISGLHVMVVAQILAVLALLLFLPARWAGTAALPFVWAYVIMIGAPPSAVRAALMASFYFAAPVFWRRPDSVRAWALAFLVMHIVNPRLIANVGSQLSFAVMLALVLVNRYMKAVDLVGEMSTEGAGNRTVVLLRRGAVKFLPTFAAWAIGVPIAACAFGRVTPGALIANLLLIAAAAYSVAAGTVGVLVSFVSERAAAHFNNLAALFTDAMVGISEAVSRLPFANFEIEGWTFVECAEWYALFALTLVLVWLCRRDRVF